jgi:hypothetical protein
MKRVPDQTPRLVGLTIPLKLPVGPIDQLLERDDVGVLLGVERAFAPELQDKFLQILLSAEPLMGWTSSADTRAQLRLRFDTLEEAIAYAQKEGLMYSVERPHERKVKPKAYADNFKYDRLGRWTH